MFSHDSIVGDIAAMAFTFCFCGYIIELLGRAWKKNLIDVTMYRKLSHASMGLPAMLCWPMFSGGRRGAVLAGLAPCLLTMKAMLVGLGISKDEKYMKRLMALNRYKSSRELVKAILGYVLGVALTTALYWRTCPLAIATICNLCAGDAMAAIAGRRIESKKLPYNRNKTIVGSIAMAIASFLTSTGYMLYFSWLGYIQESSSMVVGFLIVSIASALVESHPVSTKFDDNVTVPLASIFVGSFVL